MRKVAIVTDTTACVPPQRVAEYDIEIVPVELIFENKSYRDGIDITPAQFYALLKQAEKLPTTSASSPDPYYHAYLNASRKAENIFCLTEPARFSAMFNSARIAVDMAKIIIPKVRIEVLESVPRLLRGRAW